MARCKRVETAAQQDTHVIGSEIGGDEIQHTVAVQIAEGDGPRLPTCGEVPTRLELTVSDSEKDAHRIAHVRCVRSVCDDEVLDAVPINVSNCHRPRFQTGFEVLARLKRAVPVPEQHTDRLTNLARERRPAVRDCNINVAVVVQVARRYRERPDAGLIVLAWIEGAVPEAQQYRNCLSRLREGAGVCGDEVEESVSIEVCERNGHRPRTGYSSPEELKRTIAVAEQDAHLLVWILEDSGSDTGHKVQDAVSIEITDRD